MAAKTGGGVDILVFFVVKRGVLSVGNTALIEIKNHLCLPTHNVKVKHTLKDSEEFQEVFTV